MGVILDTLTGLLINTTNRWILFFFAIGLTIFSFSQEIMRYSTTSGFSGLSMNIQLYILSMIGVFGFFLTFLGLWLTVPFTDKLPDYWYLPIFILMMAYYTQFAISTKPVKQDDTLNPPPSHILPKKYRILLVWVILIVDILIFLQFFIYMGVVDYTKNTVLHQFLLERFGGFYTGNKLAFLVNWIGLIYVLNDVYSIYLQHTFIPCKYLLPKSWN